MHEGSRFPVIENNYRHLHPLLCCYKTANGAGDFLPYSKAKRWALQGAHTYTQTRDVVGQLLLAIFRGRSMVTVNEEFILITGSTDRALSKMQGI